MRRKALAVAGKELRHLLHDRLTLALTIGLPVLHLILYGFALDTRIRHIPAAVLNHDEHAAGRLLAQRIAGSPLFSVVSSYRSAAEIESALRTGVIRVGIEIPADYTANMVYQKQTGIRVWVDGADIATSNYLLAAMDAIGFEETMDQARRLPPGLREVSQVGVQSKVFFNTQGRTAVFLIPGLIAILVQTITALLMALSITTERERGTLEQMLATPLGPGAILAGKFLAVGCLGLAESCLLVVMMRWMFTIPIEGSLLLLIGILPLLVLAPLGIGLLIAAKSRNQLQALQLANLVLLPSVMLSGFIFPLEFVRFPISLVSAVLPSTYVVALMRNVVLRGSSAWEVMPQLAVAAVFGLVLTGLGLWAAKRSLTC